MAPPRNGRGFRLRGGRGRAIPGRMAQDWNPDRYAAFGDMRLRPALDLLAQVPQALRPGTVVDLGCGAGAAGPALRDRWPDRPPLGVDASPAMLDRARATGAYARLDRADIATWQPEVPPALIFSNAVLHWLPRHDRLIPRLAGMLAPGGVLAVQVPGNWAAPSHRLLRQAAARLFPGRFPRFRAPVLAPAAYLAMARPLGRAQVWETTYLMALPAPAQGHPVRAFTESTAMRPYLAALTPDQGAALTAAYDSALDRACPRDAAGGAVLPFRRIFLVLERA